MQVFEGYEFYRIFSFQHIMRVAPRTLDYKESSHGQIFQHSCCGIL